MGGGAPQPDKAFTHHNITELQHSRVFLPHLDVSLSLDHRRLSVLNQHTHEEENLILDPQSSDEELRKASRLLTSALKPLELRSSVGSAPAGAELVSVGDALAPLQAKTTPASAAIAIQQPERKTSSAMITAPASVAAIKPDVDSALAALFQETDAVRINCEIFRRLGEWLGIPPQDVRLTLPLVFENRRFEILGFEQQEITSIAQLRGVEFYGFYLSHINDKKVLLVYACNGMHIEWGPGKCVLQPSIKSEVEEYKGSVLLGMAQDSKNEFVFVVQPDFKKWIMPREMPYTDENLQFLTVADLAAAPDDYKLIWPQRPSRPG
jgi:hypothetical protein